ASDAFAADAPHREILELFAARAYAALGDAEQSLAFSRRGLELAKGAGTSVEAMLTELVGRALRMRGDGPGALTQYKKAMALGEAAHDEFAAAVAEGGIAGVLFEQGDIAGAVGHLRSTLGHSVRLYGSDDAEVGAVETTLAAALEAQGDLAGALDHNRRALAIMEKALGRDRAEVALLAYQVGRLLLLQPQSD